MKKGLWAHLIVQAFLAGSALLLLLGPVLGLSGFDTSALGNVLFVSLAAQLLFTYFEDRLSPKAREKEYHRTTRLITHGPFARVHWGLGVAIGMVLPVILLLIPSATLLPLAGALALFGLWIEEDVFVRAGQTLPIS
jgi:Ni/Fe-hydrogenase subunit HybB-like protein